MAMGYFRALRVGGILVVGVMLIAVRRNQMMPGVTATVVVIVRRCISMRSAENDGKSQQEPKNDITHGAPLACRPRTRNALRLRPDAAQASQPVGRGQWE